MNITFPITAREMAERLGAEILGAPDRNIYQLAALSEALPGSISYATQAKHAALVGTLRDVVVIAPRELAIENTALTFLIVDEPQGAFAKLATGLTREFLPHGISPLAVIDPTAILGEGVCVGPYVVIEAGARVGARTALLAHSYIGPQVEIGEDCRIGPRSTLLHQVVLGDRVKIGAGSVVGADGFGIRPNKNGELGEIPQLGSVHLENDVRLGANCTIDRATLGTTFVGPRTKMDDQVHVGHNVRIGADCILCGGAMVAGSAVLEDRVVLGGQAGIGDHTKVGKGARLGGQSGSGFDLKGDTDYFLTPAMPVKESMRLIALWKKLPELASRLRRLEKSVFGEGK